MPDQRDPSSLSILVVLDGERCGAVEHDSGRADSLANARATRAEVFDGPPSFKDMQSSEADAVAGAR
jgi:hypothetical protein